MVFLIRSRQRSLSGTSLVPDSSLWAPKCWIFSQASLTLVRPSVAEEPLRKWPRELSWLRSLFSLGTWRFSQRPSSALMPVNRLRMTNRQVSMFRKVFSACSKKPRTMPLENSRSSSSSSISRI